MSDGPKGGVAPPTNGNYRNPRDDAFQALPPAFRTLLDVGCGEGDFAARVREARGAVAQGIEVVPEAAAVARTRIDRVIEGDITSALAQLDDGYYDVVTCNDVLEHLVSPEAALAGLRGKLAPGGLPLASIPNARHYRYLIHLLYDKDRRYETWGIRDRSHLRFFTKKSALRLFEDCGYQVIRIAELHATRSLRPWLLNLVTLGGFGADTRAFQFLTVAVPDPS